MRLDMVFSSGVGCMLWALSVESGSNGRWVLIMMTLDEDMGQRSSNPVARNTALSRPSQSRIN